MDPVDSMGSMRSMRSMGSMGSMGSCDQQTREPVGGLIQRGGRGLPLLWLDGEDFGAGEAAASGEGRCEDLFAEGG